MRVVVLVRGHPVVPVAGALTHSSGRMHGGDIDHGHAHHWYR